MAKKENRVQVILECTEQKESGVPGMSRYITTKNKKNTTKDWSVKNTILSLRKLPFTERLNNKTRYLWQRKQLQH